MPTDCDVVILFALFFPGGSTNKTCEIEPLPTVHFPCLFSQNYDTGELHNPDNAVHFAVHNVAIKLSIWLPLAKTVKQLVSAWESRYNVALSTIT